MKINKEHPRPKFVRAVKNQRLVYYGVHATADFWEDHWQSVDLSKLYRYAEQGYLGWFEKPFTRYLPKTDPIVEAGCGLGQWVLALKKRGYNVIGIEWASETVQRVRALYPSLPIYQGDVTQIAVPDEFFSAYISLGVIEHRQEGPDVFLTEAYRVLKRGGIALISVPHFHALRKFKAALGLYDDLPPIDLPFYQYAFSREEIIQIVQAFGFHVIEVIPYDGIKGIKDEIRLIEFLMSTPGFRHLVGKALQVTVAKFLGHMQLVVCVKN